MLRLALSAFAGFAWGCSAAVAPPVLPLHGAAESAQETCAGGDMPLADQFAFAVDQEYPTRQQLLDRYSRRGYRLLLADAGHLIFEKLPAGMQPHEYLHLYGPENPRTFERKVNEAALRGFRLSWVSDPIMERPRPELPAAQYPADSRRYDYIVLSTRDPWLESDSTKEFERQISDAASKGFRPRAVYTIEHWETEDYSGSVDYEEYVVVLESTPESPSTPAAAVVTSDTYPLVAFDNVRKGTARLSSYISRGYRITGSNRSVVVLRYAPEHGPFEHLVLEPRGRALDTVSGDAQREMNWALSRGFRMAANGLFLAPGFTIRLGLVMEKSAEAASILAYMVISAARVSTLRRKLHSAFAQGFTPVAMKMYPQLGGKFVVLEKPRSRCR